uniref:No apical meristem-associated C-terminal domain-containing protein n=1 Tax=Brassica oleracea var. oleracea TaxID=109376 RepID=A0A0D3DP37_BRAOL
MQRQFRREADQYPPEPEAGEGISRTCYCGSEVVVETSYTRKDPGSRYFSCNNVDDGDSHIWKWWDVAIQEELRETQTQLRMVKDQFFESDQKVAKLDKIVGVLTKKTSVINYGLAKGVSVLVLVILVIVMGCQSSVDLESPEPAWFGSQGPDEFVFHPGVESSFQPGVQSAVQPTVESANKERRKWSPNEDKILIGAWLNTSKDPIVSCDQKAERFWKRIVDYYNASPQLVGTVPRELGPAKQRWARINEQVCKFVGCYEAALRGQRSGQNEDDVMKAALDSFFNIYEHKFSLEHAWRELRHDQKWCTTYMVKDGGKEKRKQVVDVDTEDDVAEPESRPVGVKAAKAAGKRKKSGKEEEMSQLQSIMEMKEKLSKQKILERLLAKKDPLSEMEESLKLKLMTEML